MTTRIANVDTNIVFSWCVTHLFFSLCVCVCAGVSRRRRTTEWWRRTHCYSEGKTTALVSKTALQVEQGFLEGYHILPQSPLFQSPVSNCQFPIDKCPRAVYTDT